MPRQPTPDDRKRPVSVLFPMGGINVSTGYSAQPQGTTPVGVNVRGFDAGTLRARGGTRPGLTPFFGAGSTAQVDVFHPVQSLTTIVWVSASAVG